MCAKEMTHHRSFFSFQRKRGRPPKTKSSDGPTPIANYTKHTHINPTGLTLTPAMTNPIMLNNQMMKVRISSFPMNFLYH